MRKVSLKKAKAGMKLARPIISPEGRILLSDGVVLRESFIDRLKDIGVSEVYVEDEVSKDIYVQDVISDQTRIEARALVKKVMEDVAAGDSINFSAVSNTVNKIIDELIYNRNIMINLEDIKTVDSYTFSHSVNVCVLSVITGINLGYNQLRLRELGIGALLHDIGKVMVPQAILNKPEPLTDEEFEEMKKHAVLGHEILKKNNEIGYTSRYVALAHHERYDGSGYPLKLKGEDIHVFARIVAVTDVYDALTSDRPYRERIRRDQAIYYLTSMSGKHFDRQIIDVFLKSIPVYPPGTIVVLSSGEKGIVIDVNREYPVRPIVRILRDSYGNVCHGYKEIDLAKIDGLNIVSVCEDI